MGTRVFYLLLAAVLCLSACTQRQTPEAKAPIRVRTEIVTATAATSAAGREYVGTVEEVQATAVSFTSMGTVRRVLVSEGQAVSRGQLLAELDDTQAHNLLEGAQASAAQAEDALQRYQLLHDRGSVTDAQWVEIQSKVAQARSQLALARKNVADCRLTAPVSGIVGRKSVSAGETVMPSQAVVTILDISTVKVKFSVPEAEVAAITPQTPTRIHIEAINAEVQGGRIEKGIQADMLTHTYDMRVRVENKDRLLLPGMVAKVEATLQSSHRGGSPSPMGEVRRDGAGHEVVGQLPLTSVQRRSDGTLFVWTVAADSCAHRTAVTIGAAVGNRVEITEGLTEGLRVVTEGYQKLSEGTKVTY